MAMAAPPAQAGAAYRAPVVWGTQIGLAGNLQAERAVLMAVPFRELI